ncbi:class I SAM-dependent methyltransferase [Aporhodopirellula aestuarii]|uniref:Methyltransferase domain-containing protein n=1 Tax=Aporhodopirellula aestuarii TaxID=2950107 RepID=A0ABT0UAW1_9BACT|nr:class I SAM-dependent methyltransferase [Aporhodopirellula aestuarii]MCM2374040.1 methyltransferase domain-containing protein [Aporhodopirellula aestuarii]
MCNACQIKVDNLDNATEAFAGELLETLNRSAVGQGISLGHRTGLFDVMSEMNRWATSDEIADTAQCNERYVREWLGIMVTGGIVAYDKSTKTYLLPEHHAALLTRAAVSNNFARTFQFFPVMAEVETDIVECFKKGGGVPYEKFTRFHEVMAEDSDGNVVAALFDTILPLVPGLIEKLERGIDVLDIGCGLGHALTAMAERFPNSRFVGRDMCDTPIESAKQEVARRGLTNIRFEVADVAKPAQPESFDLITAFDVIHDQRDPATVLSQVRRALRSGGTFLMQDLQASSELHENIDHPLGSFLYTVSTMHCMTVSLAQGGAGLGTVWGEQLAVKMLGEAGFENVTVRRLEHDIQNNWYVSQLSE